ncbi:MAG: M1 family aminopeptidase [Sandaracinaceae bacterium]
MHHRHLCAHARAAAAAGARRFRLPGDETQYARARAFSLDAMSLDLTLDLPGKSVAGTAQLSVRRVDPEARWARFDAIHFEIDAVERLGDSSHEAVYDYDGETLRVDLSDLADGASADVRVRYRATPRRGLYFTAPDASRPDRPQQVWSQCQDQDGRHWFPCQDHPGQRMKTEIAVVVPETWFALSNGHLISKTPAEGGMRFHWRHDEPHPAYLVTLAAGEFDEAHTEVGGVPVDYYVPKGKGDMIERSLGRTPEMIEVFAKRLGTDYPWNKYAQVVVADFIFGGMENTSATTLFERALLDERAALDVDMDALVAHELAHQWFGDLVTCRDWSHAWLNEGFATYLEHLWKEHAEGRDAYVYNLEQDLSLYLAEHGGRYGRPIVEKVWSTPIDIFDRHLYQKGGLVLHALREHLGDALFFRGLKEYLAKHRGTSVETRDLLRALEGASGRSLEGLFQQWVERAGHPSLKVSAEVEDEQTKLTLEQTQTKKDADAFRLRIPVEITTETGVERHVVELKRARDTFVLPTGGRATRITFDPSMSAPGPLDLKLSTKLLIASLSHREGPARPRWCAARALAKKNEPRARAALAEALTQDPFWAVRAEAAKALAAHRTEDAFDGLAAGEKDSEPRVRREVAGALGAFQTTASADRLLAWIDRGDDSYLVEAALRRALGKTRDARAFDVLAASLRDDRGSWGDVVQASAADGLTALKDPRYVGPLTATLEEVTTPVGVRRSIVTGLAQAPTIVSDKPTLRRIREVAERELDTYDPNLRISVARLMASLGDRAGFTVLRRLRERDLDGRVRRAAREASRDLSKRLESPPELASLRDTVDKLQQEVRELRAKVGTSAAES